MTKIIVVEGSLEVNPSVPLAEIVEMLGNHAKEIAVHEVKTECPVCLGDGWIDCDSCFASLREVCWECSGEGVMYDYDDNPRTCQSCSGSGLSDNDCTECEATGCLECPNCGSTGEIEAQSVILEINVVEVN